MKPYHEAAHAMQSGVAAKMQYDPKDTDPKHLRVGVNSAMVETAALAKLLIAKGVFTDVEYAQALTEGMNEEAASYERWLTAKLGKPITLG